jgi:hypothetical protein
VFVRDTNSKLETRHCVDPIIYLCRKYRQLAHQVGAFVACFSLKVLMVHSPKHTVIADSQHQTSIGFTHGETIHFGNVEFITDHFGSLILSDKGNDLGAVFVGMAHSGSPSLRTILEDSAGKGDNL